MITHHGRDVKILGERFMVLAHEGKTGIALIVYQPEDRRWEDTDDVTGVTRVSHHGEIRYLVVVDGKTKEDGIIDNWSYYDKD